MERLAQFDAVLLDLDGTLIQSGTLWRDAEFAFLATHGLAWSDANSERLVGGNLERAADVIAEVTGRRFELAALRDGMLSLVISNLENEVPWTAGAQAFVHALHQSQTRSGLVTSSYRSMLQPILRGLAPVEFDVVVARDDVERPKPDPEPYARAAAALDLQPSRIVAFEDSVSGARAAVTAGCALAMVGDADTGDLPVLFRIADFTDLASAGR